MNVPIEISFHDVQHDDRIEELIRRQCQKLDRTFHHISSCRVVVEQPQRHRRTGNPYRVRIDMMVPPGHEVAVNYESKDTRTQPSLGAVVRDAFAAARRQLQKLTELQRADVKVHPEQEASAVVTRLFPELDYGFLRTLDGRDIYFHRRAVLNGGFIRLEVGTGVRYDEEEGEEGPQASTVEIVNKPGVAAGRSEPGVPGLSSATPPPGWK